MRALKPGGHYVACAFNPTSLFLGPLISKKGNKKVSSLSHKAKLKDLVFMRDLLEAKKVVPVIDRKYPLKDVAEAMRYLEGGHHHGKVIITMEQNIK